LLTGFEFVCKVEGATMMNRVSTLSRAFSRVATTIATLAGKPITFASAVGCVVVWGLTGPVFGYSDTWQLVINTATTIVTFLMVFLIQNSQNRDGAAIQVKLDELIRVSAAKNFFVGIEHLTGEEIERLRTMLESRAQGANRLVGAIAKKAADAADRAG
jgi:low affinity Fe/Cu permease